MVGYFKAATADDAIHKAIDQLAITNPPIQARLAASRVREVTT